MLVPVNISDIQDEALRALAKYGKAEEVSELRYFQAWVAADGKSREVRVELADSGLEGDAERFSAKISYPNGEEINVGNNAPTIAGAFENIHWYAVRAEG